MVMAPDAAAVLGLGGQDANLDGIDDLARAGSAAYQQNVVEKPKADNVRMYHPDGTSSIILLPPLGKNGRNLRERRQIITSAMFNKRGPKGEQWFYAAPPPGWEPTPLPYRCPVEGCSRRGGLPNLLNVYRHMMQKHPGEAEMYQGVLNAIKAKLQTALTPDLAAALGLDQPADKRAVVSVADLEAARLAAAADARLPDASDIFVEGCPDCDFMPPVSSSNPAASLAGHRRAKHSTKAATQGG